MATETKLNELFEATLDDLLARIRSGEATSADLSVARQLLKDNGIDVHGPSSPKTKELAITLPFGQSQDTQEDHAHSGVG